MAMTGSASRVQFLPSPPDDPRRRRPDIGKAERILNWQPTVPLEEGLRRTIGYFRQALSEPAFRAARSEEHTSELQSLMRISYAVFCLTKKTHRNKSNTTTTI